MTAASAAAQSIIYVDDGSPAAPAAQDGDDWPTAFASLEDALAAVSVPANTQIWLAEGLYTPGYRVVPMTTSTTLRSDTFTVPSGLEIYGGFAGTEASIGARTGSAALTLLTGDLLRDGNDTNNCYHVVTVTSGDEQALLDRLTIRDGEADGTGDTNGGGVYCEGSDLYLDEVRLVENSADERGGGIYFKGSTGSSAGDGFRALRCEFSLNDAGDLGGAIHFEKLGIPAESSPGISQDEPSWIFNCEFDRNLGGAEYASTGVGGGAINVQDRIERTEWFATTSAHVDFGDPTIVEQSWTLEIANSLFKGNITDGVGSSIRIQPTTEVEGGRIVIRECTMAGDTLLTELPEDTGTATVWITGEEDPIDVIVEPNHAVSSTLMMACVVMAPNSSPSSNSSIDAIDGAAGTIATSPSAFNATDLVVWDSDVQQSAGAVIHSGTSAGNINADPEFVNYGIGNLRLQSTSPCIDDGAAGATSQLLPLDYPDLDGSASTARLPVDLDESTRVVNGGTAALVDMGAYEYDPN